MRTENGMCPKCFTVTKQDVWQSSGRRACSQCGTETFRMGGKIPRKGSKKWKDFLKSKKVRDEIAEYKKNPVKDWLTVAYERGKAAAKSALAMRRASAMRISNNGPKTYEVRELVCLHKGVVTGVQNPNIRSVWFRIMVKPKLWPGITQYIIYNGTTVIPIGEEDGKVITMGTRKRPKDQVKKKLDAAVEKFVAE
jgi:hypothetical protein